MGGVIPKRRRLCEQRYSQTGHCRIPSPGLAQTSDEQHAVWTVPHWFTRFSNDMIYIITCSCWSQSVPAASSRGRYHACRLLSCIKLSPLLILVNGTISALPSSVPNRHQVLAIGLHSLFAVSPFRPSPPFMGVQGTFSAWKDIFLTLLLSPPDASYLQLSDRLLENTNV